MPWDFDEMTTMRSFILRFRTVRAMAWVLACNCWLLHASGHAQSAAPRAEAVRIKELAKVQGWRENALMGYGVVSGLAGTGDSPSNRSTRQSLSNLLSQFKLTIGADQIQSRNVAMVMVTASLPPFAREGDTLDVSVTSVGDARSLVGGTLLLTSLQAANGRTYALAQGALQVGGFRHDAQGNVVQKNHPTVGSVPNGAIVELGLTPGAHQLEQLTLVLNEPDYTTAQRVADAVNQRFGQTLASARDAAGIDVKVPSSEQSRPVAFLAQLESVTVQPDLKARVVINERTGTIVSGSHVRIAPVAISHGDLKLAIVQTQTASLPPAVVVGGAPAVVLNNSQIDIQEDRGVTLQAQQGMSVGELVQQLARMKTHTRDVISILRAIKAAGALRAELIVQ